MTQTNQPDRLVLISKAAGVNFEKQFFLDIQNAIIGGYRIAETDLRDDMSMRNFRGRLGRAVLYKEGTQPEKWTPAVVAPVEEAPVKEPAPIVKEEVSPEKLSSGKAENAPVETLLEQLDAIEDYKGLKAFAEENDIEIPAKTYNPKAVKKIIKKALEA